MKDEYCYLVEVKKYLNFDKSCRFLNSMVKVIIVNELCNMDLNLNEDYFLYEGLGAYMLFFNNKENATMFKIKCKKIG